MTAYPHVYDGQRCVPVAASGRMHQFADPPELAMTASARYQSDFRQCKRYANSRGTYSNAYARSSLGSCAALASPSMSTLSSTIMNPRPSFAVSLQRFVR